MVERARRGRFPEARREAKHLLGKNATEHSVPPGSTSPTSLIRMRHHYPGSRSLTMGTL